MKINMKLMLACVGFACAAATFAAMPGSNDGFNPNADGAVRALAVQPDGKIIAGGDFTAVGGAVFTRIARINTDGTTDTTFAAVEVNDAVVAVAIQNDGKILIGGRFSRIGGAVHNYIARLYADGTVDPDFLGTGANGWVDAIAVQPDGKIVLAGSFTSVNGKESHKIARLQTNGLVDNSFDGVPGADRSVFAIALQPDGKIIAAGEYTGYDGEAHNRIVRLNTNGSLDNSFTDNIGPSSNITALKLQADGKILVGGYFQYYNGGPIGRVVRLNANGSIDQTFDADDGADDYINAIETQPDGRILVAGSFVEFDGTIRSRIARLELTGALDPTFIDTQTSDTICAIAAQPDGKIVIGGDFTEVGGTGRNHIARLERDGSPDTTFFAYYFPADETMDYFMPRCAVTRPDGTIILGGESTYPGSINKYDQIRIVNTDGSAVRTIQMPANNWVNGIIMQPDGKWIVAGKFTSIAGTNRIAIARFNADGTPDDSFNTLIDDANIYGMSLQRDGKILICGIFNRVGSVDRHNVARLNSDGSLDRTFDPGVGADGNVYFVAARDDGKIYIGGSFYTFNWKAHRCLLRVNADGSDDNSFQINRGPDNWLTSILLLPDDKVLVGGWITDFNGTPCSQVARLNPDGSVDNTFDTTPVSRRGGRVNSMALQADGKIVIAGNFTDYCNSGRDYVVRLNPNGSIDNTFDDPEMLNNLYAASVQPDGKIYVSGPYYNPGVETLTRFANPGAARQELALSADGSAIAWRLGGSFPWPFRVLFEESTDGISWREIGWGTPEPSFGYRLSPAAPVVRNHFVRATGWAACGMYNASASMFQSVLWNGQPAPPFTGAMDWMHYE